jgi:Rrf2 family iron-sulfur cluster assembly transcriptional regulator
LSEQIHNFLKGISLADLVARKDVQEISDRQDRINVDQFLARSDTMALSDKAAI